MFEGTRLISACGSLHWLFAAGLAPHLCPRPFLAGLPHLKATCPHPDTLIEAMPFTSLAFPSTAFILTCCAIYLFMSLCLFIV